MKNKLLLMIVLFSFPFFAFSSNAKIQSISVKKEKERSVINLKYNGSLDGDPKLVIKQGKELGPAKSIVQLEIPNSIVWPKIEKKVDLGGNKFDTTLMAYQFNKGVVRFRVVLPYKLNELEEKVFIKVNSQKITVSIPLENKKRNSKNIAGISLGKVQKNMNHKRATNYDEELLEQLLKDKKINKKEEVIVEKKVIEDQVKNILSSSKKVKPKFSISKYVGKFAAFLGLILLVFYGIIHLMKKGVIKKSRLSFLNNMNTVNVLNTTYIGPKKNLVLVKVHEQVLLLGSDEKGIHFLTDVKNPTGLLKEGEKTIAGSNFDTTLVQADKDEKEFNLKTENQNVKIEKDVSVSVKFSDQIKNKVKNLKSLQ